MAVSNSFKLLSKRKQFEPGTDLKKKDVTNGRTASHNVPFHYVALHMTMFSL